MKSKKSPIEPEPEDTRSPGEIKSDAIESEGCRKFHLKNEGED